MDNEWICVDCREPIDDCRCPPIYDEQDAADERYQLELDERD